MDKSPKRRKDKYANRLLTDDLRLFPQGKRRRLGADNGIQI